MTSTPTSDNVRLTISVTPHVHATFQRFSKAASMSMSKAIGEWLLDTIEAAEYTALKMEQARAAPRQVMQEMHAYALGLVDETNAVMDKLRKDGRAARKPKAEGSARADDHPPRPVIRGGKSPGKTLTPRTPRAPK